MKKEQQCRIKIFEATRDGAKKMHKFLAVEE